MTKSETAPAGWFLAGMIVVLLIFWLPPLLVVLVGWPGGSTPAAGPQPGPVEAIAGPSPATGLSPELTRWTLVSAAVSLGFALGACLLALLVRKKIGTGPDTSLSVRFHLLITLGVVSLVAYGLNFLLPFPLHKYFNLKQISMGMIAHRNGDVALGSALATVALFLLYGLAYYLCRGQSKRRLWLVVLIGAALFALVNSFVATTTTLDPYDYIARGRITGLHGGNPYVLTPENYPDDPFMEYVSWRSATSAYGPLWETLSALTSRLAGNQLWSNMLAYKGIALLGYLCCVLLVAATLRRVAPTKALSGTLLFAWNPLILMEGPGNGHNDLLMVALLIGAFWALSRVNLPLKASPLSKGTLPQLANGWLVLILLTAAALVKFVPLLLLPLLLLYLLAGQEGWKRWLGWGLLLLIPIIALVVEYYFPFWNPNAIADTFTRRADMFRMSVASVSKEALQQAIDASQAQAIVSWPFLGAFVVGYVGVLVYALRALTHLKGRLVYWLAFLGGFLTWGLLGAWVSWSQPWILELILPRAWLNASSGVLGLIDKALLTGLAGGGLGIGVAFLSKRWQTHNVRPWNFLTTLSLAAFLLYLLLANFWFWPWYLVWPIAILALSGNEKLVLPLVLTCCAGELSHLGWNFAWFWWGISWDTTFQMDALVVFWMVVPAVVAYAVLSLRDRFRQARNPTS